MAGVVKNKKIIFCLIVAGVLIANSAVLAELLTKWPDSPGIPKGTHLDENSGLSDLIKYFYEWAVSLGGLAVFIVLVIAGIQFLTSAGNPAQMTEAKGRIQSAAFGLILLLGSVLILNTINPQLTALPELEFQPYIEGMDTCEKNEDCPENKGITEPEKYESECVKGFCVPKLNPLPTEGCEKVNLTGGATCEISPTDTPCTIPTGATFDATSQPEDCAGILQFYLRIAGGKCESLHSSVGVNSKDISLDETIRCAKLSTATKK